MKIWIVSSLLLISQICAAADSAGVAQGISQLRDAREELNVIIKMMPPGMASFTTQLIDIQTRMAQADISFKRALGNDVPPTPGPAPAPAPTGPKQVGYYCEAACTNVDGSANAGTARGAGAPIQLQANQAALDAVKSAYNCNYGITVVSCGPQYDQSIFNCNAACADISGNATNSTLEGGAGKSLLEATIAATVNLQAAYTCDYGMKSLDCSTGLQNNYCIAACNGIDGTANLTTSKGAAGRNKADAEAQAMLALRKAYSCDYGAQVTQCQGE